MSSYPESLKHMANEEQLTILKQGVKVWNEWRRESPDIEIDLRGAYLRDADLTDADLTDADLTQADLEYSSLTGAKLTDSLLTSSHLEGVGLIGASLRGANLEDAHLDRAQLIMTDLSKATITGAYLYGTARDDWIIDGINCDFVYWDNPDIYYRLFRIQWRQEHRIPKDRDFRSGEFEELYKHLPTFTYYFEQSFTPLDPLIMDRVVQAINERRPEIELKLDSFHSRGQAHVVFTVLHKDNVEEALEAVTAGYARQLDVIKAERDLLERLFMQAIKEPRTFIERVDMRDIITVKGHGKVNHLTTGDTFQDRAQKLIGATTPQAPQQGILRVLSFIQEELPKLPLPEDVKEDVEHELKGAEILAKKPEPDKKKLADRLKSAVAALKGAGELGQEAVILGQLIGKAILWCGEQITDFL